MTRKERIIAQLQGIADDLRTTDSWQHVERLADYIENVNALIEVL